MVQFHIQCNAENARLFDESDELHASVAKNMNHEWEEQRTIRVARNVRRMRRSTPQTAQAQGGERRRRRTKRRRSDGDRNAARRRSPRLAAFDAAVGAAPDEEVERRKTLKEKLQDLHLPGGWAGFEHELFRYEHMSDKALWTRMIKIKRLDKLQVSDWKDRTRSLGRCMPLEWKKLTYAMGAFG